MKELVVYDKEDNLLKTIELTEDVLMNKRFRRKNSMLDILIENDIQIFFGCMGGSCSACKCKIISGREHIDNEGISRQVYKDVKDDEVLSCITTINDNIPDDVKIEVKVMM